jgi:hypothetical protein
MQQEITLAEQTPNTPPRNFKIGTTTIADDRLLAGKPLDEVTGILKRTYPEVAQATIRQTTLEDTSTSG